MVCTHIIVTFYYDVIFCCCCFQGGFFCVNALSCSCDTSVALDAAGTAFFPIQFDIFFDFKFIFIRN